MLIERLSHLLDKGFNPLPLAEELLAVITPGKHQDLPFSYRTFRPIMFIAGAGSGVAPPKHFVNSR